MNPENSPELLEAVNSNSEESELFCCEQFDSFTASIRGIHLAKEKVLNLFYQLRITTLPSIFGTY